MLKTILLSCAAFIGTNIDDLFINMLFFADAASSRQSRRITLGKYLGMGVLTAFSILSAFGLRLLPVSWLSLLGFVPIALGIKAILQSIRKTDEEAVSPHPSSSLGLSVMLITIANGADNLGVYIPLFTGFTPWQTAVSACVFAAMTGLSCLLACRLSALPVLRRFLDRYRPVIIPAVYILLGLYILFKSH